MQTIRQTCDTAWLAKEIRVDELTVDKNKFELTQAVEDNCKCRSRHRFMIATTAIRYELTARSSNKPARRLEDFLESYGAHNSRPPPSPLPPSPRLEKPTRSYYTRQRFAEPTKPRR